MSKLVVGVNDFATEHPELLVEWDYERNRDIGVFPDRITCGSHRKVWWKCQNGHEWQATVPNRIYGRGCPYCAGKKVWVGYNDFESNYPQIAKEWHPTKNGDLKPNMFSWCSGKKVWWRCRVCGYEWRTTIAHRTSNKRGCPKCNSVHSTSFSEQVVFYYLKKCFSDALNRYKLTDNNGSFEVDIYVPSLNVAVEYDGEYWHRNRKHMDNVKGGRIANLGIRFYRIVESNENKVVGDFVYYDFYHDYEKNLNWAIRILFGKLGIVDVSGFIGIDKIDNDSVAQLFYVSGLKNSFAHRYPQMAKEWDYEKNGGLRPECFMPYTHRKVWFKCKNGHSWKTAISNRARDKCDCPYCSNQKVLVGYNDLATKFPSVVKEWNYEKNGSLLPSDIVFGSNKRVWWQCSVCGHEWQAIVSTRTVRGYGCPKCADRLAGKKKAEPKLGSSLADLHPRIAKEWNHERNNGLLPSQVACGSGRKVWWKCSKGHEWETAVNARVRETNCPFCSNKRVLVGYNDLATLKPDLAEEWDYEKNGDLLPTMVVVGSHKKVWWRCKDCGYEWRTYVNKRSRENTGCPNCRKRKKTIIP